MSRHAIAAALLALPVVMGFALPYQAWALAPSAASTRLERQAHGAHALAPQARAALPSMCAEQVAAVSARASAKVLHELGLVEDGSVPWCITADDARCSPRHESGVPAGAHADAKLCTAADISTSLPRPSEVKATLTACAPGAPREATRMRVERPPRVGRQAV